MAAHAEATAALRRQATIVGAPTVIAASRNSLPTRRAAILHRGRIPLLAGAIPRRRAPIHLRQAAVTAAEAATALRAVTVVAGVPRAVMEAEAVRAAMVVEVLAGALIPAEVEATRAVVEAVTPVAVEGVRTAVGAGIRIANLRC